MNNNPYWRIEMNKFTYWMAASSALAIAACTGSSSNTPATALDGDAAQASFKVAFTQAANLSGTAALIAQAAADGSIVTDAGVVLTEASLLVKEIKLDLPEGLSCSDAGFVAAATVSCKDESESEEEHGTLTTTTHSRIKIEGPIRFDLIAGTSDPSLEGLSLPSGVYRKIKLELDDSGEDHSGTGSIVLAGTYPASDGSPIDFSISFDASGEIEMENVGGIEVAEGVTNVVLAQLDVNAWLAGIDFAACVAEGHCDSLKEGLKSNMDDSFDLSNDDSKDDSADDNSGDSSGHGSDDNL